MFWGNVTGEVHPIKITEQLMCNLNAVLAALCEKSICSIKTLVNTLKQQSGMVHCQLNWLDFMGIALDKSVAEKGEKRPLNVQVTLPMASSAARTSDNTALQKRIVSGRLKITYFIKNVDA